MRKWVTQHDVLTKLLSIVAAFILWSYFMGAQNPTRTLEYKDISCTADRCKSTVQQLTI